MLHMTLAAFAELLGLLLQLSAKIARLVWYATAWLQWVRHANALDRVMGPPV